MNKFDKLYYYTDKNTKCVVPNCTNLGKNKGKVTNLMATESQNNIQNIILLLRQSFVIKIKEQRANVRLVIKARSMPSYQKSLAIKQASL